MGPIVININADEYDELCREAFDVNSLPDFQITLDRLIERVVDDIKEKEHFETYQIAINLEIFSYGEADSIRIRPTFKAKFPSPRFEPIKLKEIEVTTKGRNFKVIPDKQKSLLDKQSESE